MARVKFVSTPGNASQKNLRASPYTNRKISTASQIKKYTQYLLLDCVADIIKILAKINGNRFPYNIIYQKIAFWLQHLTEQRQIFF